MARWFAIGRELAFLEPSANRPASFGKMQLEIPILRCRDVKVAQAAALTAGIATKAATPVQPTMSRRGGALGPVFGG